MRNILFLTFILLSGCASITQNSIQEKDYSKPRHIVILIHGIGGNYKHFGHLRESLENHLGKATPEQSVEVVHFDYLTGNNKLTTTDFSRHLVRYINGYFRTTERMKASDRISLVMHSQGGIVGMLWLLNTVSEKKGFPQEYLSQLDSFITLSTPFWGSTMVNLARDIYGYTYLPYGKRELEEMAFGSQTIFFMRNNLIKYRQKLKGIRFFNIGAASSKESDSDLMVDLPSMRQDFIYNRLDKFEEIKLSQFKQIKAIHLNLLALYFNMKSFASISQAFRSCITDSECEHPSFKLILDFLKGKKIKEGSYGKGYFLGIEIKAKKLERDDILVEFALPAAKMIEIENPHPEDYYQRSTPGSYFFHYSGVLKESDYLQKKTTVTIQAPGYLPYKGQVLLKPGFTTFLTFELLPE